MDKWVVKLKQRCNKIIEFTVSKIDIKMIKQIFSRYLNWHTWRKKIKAMMETIGYIASILGIAAFILNFILPKKDITRELKVINRLEIEKNVLETMDKMIRSGIEQAIDTQITPTLSNIVKALNKEMGSSIPVPEIIVSKPHSVLLTIKTLEITDNAVQEALLKATETVPLQILLPSDRHYGEVKKMLDTASGIKILSSQQILTFENEKATIHIESIFPGFKDESIKFKNKTDIKLYITPAVEKDKLITMDIIAITPITEEVPSKPTKISVKEGEEVMLLGLSKDVGTVTTIKVPILGDIPLLGRFYTKKSQINFHSLIVVTISAKIKFDPENNNR